MAGIRALVPYDGSPEARRGLEVALRLASAVDRGKSRIHPACVVEVDRALPLDALIPDASAQAEHCLSEAEAQAAKAKVKCESYLLQSRQAGPAIVDHAAAEAVDLVVIGVAHATSVDGRSGAQTPLSRRHSGAIDLGRTADYIISHAPCEVVVVREHPEARLRDA